MPVKSSWTRKFANPIIMPPSTSRVCWNRSLTASPSSWNIEWWNIEWQSRYRWNSMQKNSIRGSAYLAKVLELANITIPSSYQSALRVCWKRLSTASHGGELLKLGKIGLSSWCIMMVHPSIDQKKYSKAESSFLDASLHLYRRVGLSVRPSIRRLVRPSVRPSIRPSVRPFRFSLN